MTILVTGASGHLGANLVRRLLNEGEAVRVLLREGDNNAGVDGLDVEKVYGDLRDFHRIKTVVKGCDRIYHCAAKISILDRDPDLEREIYDCNVLGTIHVLKAALKYGVTKVVVTGSFSAVGYDPENPSDETVPFYPFSRKLLYAFSKNLVEHECLKAFADGLNVVIATSCAVLGPHDYIPSRMGRTLIDFSKGKLLAYIPGGTEFVAARDIVEGHILAMSRRGGQKYIFSSQFLTVDELMDMFEEITHCHRPSIRIPSAVMAGVAKISDFVLPRFFPNVPRRFTSGSVSVLRTNCQVDISKAKNELGYQPTSIKASIQSAYDDFVRRGLITASPKKVRIQNSLGH